MEPNELSAVDPNDYVDVTPSPPILRLLGEIPFQPWQCIAELIDNSLDAFKKAEQNGTQLNDRRITVSWSSDSVAANDRQLEVIDNGLGMPLSAMQDAAKAGYSSKDPFNNLGLFGIGFNVATARLGEKTLLLSAEPGDTEWTGIELDFRTMTSLGKFWAKKVKSDNPKKEHGTKVIVQSLKPNIFDALKKYQGAIRDTLSDIYSPILSQANPVQITVQSKRLSQRKPCLWDGKRYVVIVIITSLSCNVNRVLTVKFIADAVY